VGSLTATIAVRALLAAAIGMAAGVTHAEPVAFIQYSTYSVAATACAQALRDSAGRLGMPNLQVLLGDHGALKALAQPPQIRINLSQRIAGWGYDVEDNALALVYMPSSSATRRISTLF
jgi:hypothetical protein